MRRPAKWNPRRAACSAINAVLQQGGCSNVRRSSLLATISLSATAIATSGWGHALPWLRPKRPQSDLQRAFIRHRGPSLPLLRHEPDGNCSGQRARVFVRSTADLRARVVGRPRLWGHFARHTFAWKCTLSGQKWPFRPRSQVRLAPRRNSEPTEGTLSTCAPTAPDACCKDRI